MVNKKKFVVTKGEIDSGLYELLKQDAHRIRKSYGKDWPKNMSCGGMVVRLGHRYWLTSNSDDLDDITIEQYYHLKEHYHDRSKANRT